jgi:hypothetical protein
MLQYSGFMTDISRLSKTNRSAFYPHQNNSDSRFFAKVQTLEELGVAGAFGYFLR